MSRAGKLATFVGLIACLAPAGAAASETRDLRIAHAVKRVCGAEMRSTAAAGVDRERWTAPAEGYLTLTLGGNAESPDWDLAAGLRDAMAASTNWGSSERVNLWVSRGDRVAIQACRRSGADRSLPLSIDLYEMEIPRGPGPRASLESVAVDGPGEVVELESLGFDVSHDVSPSAATVVLHDHGERRLLARKGFESTVLVRDLAAHDRAQFRRAARRQTRSALPSTRDDYRVYEDYTSEMKGLAAQYPGHVRSIMIGTSLEGRPIEGVEIAGGVNSRDDGRPVFLNFGLHHAREWPSGEMPIEFAIDLARGYGVDPRITSILDRVRVVIVPVVNVDGFIASRQFGWNPADDSFELTAGQIVAGSGAYRRKNCRGISPADQAIPCAARTTGVDLNRNYGAYWGGPGSSNDPAGPEAQIYRGTKPFSEPETQAVLALSESVHPTVVISNHTNTDDGKWLRQPGWNADFMPQDFKTSESYREACEDDPDGALTPDEPAMKALGDAMAAATLDPSRQSPLSPTWTSELGYETLCDITGATEDWNYFAQGAYGYTPEARGPNFHAGYGTMVVDEYLGFGSGGVRESFLLAGEEAADTDNHGVITGAAPAAATLRIEKQFSLPTCDGAACVKGNGDPVGYEIKTELEVPDSGEYAWHVNPSVRPDVYADGGPPVEAWTMTCKLPDGERSVAQQVLIRRGEQASVDWTGLCGDAAAGGGELPTCGGKQITIIGTAEDDTIIGTEEDDVIAARDGDDKVRPGKGKDIACGEGGADKIKGDRGADTLLGQKGDDLLSGQDGNDELRGATGDDRLTGGKGRNTCVGGSGRDSFAGCD